MVAFARRRLHMVLAVLMMFLLCSFSDIVPMDLHCSLLQMFPFFHRLHILHMEISRDESGVLCSSDIYTPLV